MDVDITTGLPKEKQPPKASKETEQIRKLAAEGDTLEKEFKSARGQRFIQLMIEALDKRIMELMKEDPQCQILLGILSDMKVKIASSRGLAEKIVKGSVKA